MNVKTTEFNLATFNVRGLSAESKKEELRQDLERLHVDICCLQETKIRNGVDTLVQRDRLITFPTATSIPGFLGFLIS